MNVNTIYGETPQKTLDELRRYYYGALIDVLHKKDDGYPLLDQRIQTLINQIHGSLGFFNNDPKVLSIIAWLEDARINPVQFRKDILDAANMIDQLGCVGGAFDV